MIATAANLIWLASQTGTHRRFLRQLSAPEEAQSRVLLELLRRNATTDYGRRHGFSEIRTPAQFQARVPLVTYDEILPWIRRIQAGEPNVLTSDRVTHLVPTSGSAGARKLIPFTARLQCEFNAAIGPWIFSLYEAHPQALFGPSYWSISPPASSFPKENSIVPVGFEDDTRYLGGIRRRVVAASMALPASLRQLTNTDSFVRLTLVHLLNRQNLRLISVWHPSFLLLLLDELHRQWDLILEILSTGRMPSGPAQAGIEEAGIPLPLNPRLADKLRKKSPSDAGSLWPELRLISCWTQAGATFGAAELARRFAGVTIQPKGLLATEAFVTFPLGEAHPVAITSHYFEFLDEDGRILPVQALEAGKNYEVVVTTGGGLWRYRLGDLVRVEGFVGRTPSLRFLGRSGNISDLFGEKLSEAFVSNVIGRLAVDSLPTLAFLAPESNGINGRYTLFWEGSSPPRSIQLDRLLSENFHYAWCRRMGQLGPPRIFLIRANGLARFFQRIGTGQKLGEVKPPCLVSPNDEWAQYFEGGFVD